MPLHRVKSRARFPGSWKKIKRNGGGKTHPKPTCTVLDADSQAPLSRAIVDEDFFKNKRIPSTEELGDLLESNLSASLAAEKAYLEQESVRYSLPQLPLCQHFEQVPVDDDDLPASLREFAPLTYATRDYPETTVQDTSAQELNEFDEGYSTSSFATAAIYIPLADHFDSEVLRRASSTTPTGDIRSLYQAPLEGASAADSCAIEDDEDDAARPQPSAPVPYCKGQSAFMQRVVTLFAGRRRSRRSDKDSYERTNPEQSKTPLSSPPQSAVGSPCCPVFSNDATTAVPVSLILIRPSRPPRGPSYFPKTKARLNLPVSPPILVPKGQRPHQPYDEGLSQPFIKPAPDHKLFGTYYVGPNISTPELVQQGFPDPPTRSSLTLPLPNEARFLDRTNTAWGKWYATCSRPEELPFAAAYKGAQEATDQEVWDMHVAAHARFRAPLPSPTSEEDVQRRLVDKKNEWAERLRYHAGYCFGVFKGYCCLFQDGWIVQ